MRCVHHHQGPIGVFGPFPIVSAEEAYHPIQINVLFHKLLYVSQNEETSCLKLVHFYDDELGIPSEMEANWKSK